MLATTPNALTIAGAIASVQPDLLSLQEVAAASADQIVLRPGHRRRLDYTLVGSWHAHPDASAHVHRADVAFDEVPVSDHYGVVAVIDIAA